MLLSTLAHLGHSDDRDVAANTYRAVSEELAGNFGTGLPTMLAPEECSLVEIGAALDRCDAAAPLVKRAILHACGQSVMMDGEIQSDEAELIRAIADTIGCPIPPFVRA